MNATTIKPREFAGSDARRVACQGMVLAEFLTIMVLVAIAGILVVSLFGQRVRSVFAGSVSALIGEKPTPVMITMPEPGSGGVGFGSATPAKSKEDEDKLWQEFSRKLTDGLVEAAVKNYEVNVNTILKSAAEGLDLSAAQYQEMVRRAASEYALQGELGAINTLEALQDVSSTLQRGQEASKAVAVFEVLDNGMKVMQVVGAAKDLLDFTDAYHKSITDPDHQHQHEGEMIGTAVGAVGAGTLIAVTAPVSVPVLIVGVVGAAVIGIMAKPLFSWIGSVADDAKAARKVIRVK